MTYDPKQRDDFDYGKRLYRQKPKDKPPYIIVIALIVVLAGLILMIIHKKSIQNTQILGFDAVDSSGMSEPMVSRVENSSENHEDSNTPGKTSPGTDPYTNTEKDTGTDSGTTYPSIDRQIYADIKKKIYGETDSQISPSELYNRAERYCKAGEFEKALPLFKELAIKDDRMSVFVGLCYYEMGDYSNARYYLQKVLTIDRSNALALKYLALTCYKLDDLENSLRYAEAALEIKGDHQLQALHSKLQREVKAMDGYGNAKRVNFTIVFSKFEHGGARNAVIEILEDAYREIGQQLDTFPSTPVSVILYNEKNFTDVTRAPGWAGGLFSGSDGKIRLPIKGMSVNEPRLKHILYHEYTHALIHSITPLCPRWLHEGMAEYFSLDHGQINTIGQKIPLKLLDTALLARNPTVVRIAYQESYSVVSYLVDRYRLFSIKELLEKLGSGTDFYTAFSSVFSISFNQFSETWGRE
jgi:tetratricopeptide (TPR) repeat protein